MLGTIALSPRRVDEYTTVVGEERIDELRRIAAPLRGARVLNLSLSQFGSWAADLLASSVPLLQDLGLDAQWRVVRPSNVSEQATTALYEALSGTESRWTPELRRDWLTFIEASRRDFDSRADVIVIHDPQLLALVPERGNGASRSEARWIWHCHLDMTSAEPAAWNDIRPYAERCDAVIFENRSFEPPGWLPRMVQIIAPGIDPLGPRNVPMALETAAMLVSDLGIDVERPLISQIAPFDQGSDIVGLIEVYDALVATIPHLQLAIVPTSLRDDEDTRAYFELVARLANERPGCVLPALATEIGNAEINAFRHLSQVVVQKSLRKGFALWLSEAMWRERPIVAGPTIGVAAQVVSGVTGFIVMDTRSCTERIGELIADPALSKRLGANGRGHVINHFLLTRYLVDTLQLLARMLAARAVQRGALT